MNARLPFLVLSALAIATGSYAADTPDRMRAAFLEDAPAEAAKSMKAVLAEECERVREEPLRTEADEPIDVTWLCGAKSLRFLREVLLDGTRVDDGYICDPTGLQDAKFLPLDMIEHQRCVWVSYNDDAKVHDLDLDTQLGAAEPETPAEPATKP